MLFNMGQTLASSTLLTGRESPSLSSPCTPEPQFANTRVVISQELLTSGDESPISPSASCTSELKPEHKELPGEDTARAGNVSSRAPLMMEAFIKTFEQLAVQQWPTWAKRRGWVTDYSEEANSSDPSSVDDKSDTIFEEGHHERASVRSTATEPPDLEMGSKDLLKTEKGDEVELLNGCDPTETSFKVPTQEDNGIYAMAISEKSTATVNLSDLYEMSLRWIFEPDVFTDVADFDGLPLANNDIPNECSTTVDDGLDTFSSIRIYIRLLRKSGTEISFVDFRPRSIPSTSTEQTSAPSNYEPKQQCYFAEISSDNSIASINLPRNVSCADLIARLIGAHPLLTNYKTEQLAIYEKCWFPGKTSRARLRRLNELEHPLLLSSQWQLNSGSPPENGGSVIPMTRTLVLQECQTGDIPWGEFSLAELNNFLKVLEREEASHEFYIRQKYQHLAQVLNIAIQNANKKA